MLDRIKHTWVSLFTAVDQLLQVLICAPIYLVTGRARPSARRTVSALLGQAEAKGYWWGKALARAVDFVIGKGHCNGAYLRETAFEFPL